MNQSKIRNYTEFKRWVKIRLVEEELSQRELAKRMGIPHARISEATHGKQTGNKYIIPVIEHLEGDLNDFQEFFKMIEEEKTVVKAAVKPVVFYFGEMMSVGGSKDELEQLV